ncbi:hypothetical protein G6O69_33165 [Pseudenhygromyxa sp. WMMC2535]|uniref:hypothetical protein n=1 Tax=Pseudenhygromyxa sp. WMMC2535 TaxID=2712867 RepID=UPI001557A142|nr:hypothetical protein [Pseudenhygromyxa sp. WMMC2535]NVB42719.1 hypothetical protein [Pseudenhygromyxa sp. WMMC2535]
MFRFIPALPRLAAPLLALGLTLAACDSAETPVLELDIDELEAMSDAELSELAALEIEGDIEIVVVGDDEPVNEPAPGETPEEFGSEPGGCTPQQPGFDRQAPETAGEMPAAPLRIEGTLANEDIIGHDDEVSTWPTTPGPKPAPEPVPTKRH